MYLHFFYIMMGKAILSLVISMKFLNVTSIIICEVHLHDVVHNSPLETVELCHRTVPARNSKAAWGVNAVA
jgi:hypothetical protein